MAIRVSKESLVTVVSNTAAPIQASKTHFVAVTSNTAAPIRNSKSALIVAIEIVPVTDSFKSHMGGMLGVMS